MPKLPTSVRSGYRTIEVKEVAAGRLGEGESGECDAPSGVVTIEKDQIAHEQADTLVHEMFHNELWEAGIHLGDKEEPAVRVLAHCVSRLFNAKLNPAARKFLLEAFRDG